MNNFVSNFIASTDQDWQMPVEITTAGDTSIGKLIFRNGYWIWEYPTYPYYPVYVEPVHFKDTEAIKIVEELLEQGVIKKDLDSYRKALEIISRRI